jgi:ribosomal protein S18 acetylase RimI-like enzyme
VTLRLVPFAPAMADDLVRLWRGAFEHGVGVLDPNPLDAQRAYLFEQVLPEHRVQVATEGERLVGFVASNAESVAQLHVRVGCHSRGIGSELLNAAKAASAGSLWLYTFARNARARRFYEQHGFVPIAFGFEPVWQMDDVKYLWPAPAPTYHADDG